MSSVKKVGIGFAIFGAILIITFPFHQGIMIVGLILLLIGAYLFSGKDVLQKLTYSMGSSSTKTLRTIGVVCFIGGIIVLIFGSSNGASLTTLISIIAGLILMLIGTSFVKAKGELDKQDEAERRLKKIEETMRRVVVYTPEAKRLSFIELPMNIDENNKQFDIVEHVLANYTNYFDNTEPYKHKEMVERLRQDLLPFSFGYRLLPVDHDSCIAYFRLMEKHLENKIIYHDLKPKYYSSYTVNIDLDKEYWLLNEYESGKFRPWVTVAYDIETIHIDESYKRSNFRELLRGLDLSKLDSRSSKLIKS